MQEYKWFEKWMSIYLWVLTITFIFKNIFKTFLVGINDTMIEAELPALAYFAILSCYYIFFLNFNDGAYFPCWQCKEKLPLSPEPVSTWSGMCIEVGPFYNEHFDAMKGVVNDFHSSKSMAECTNNLTGMLSLDIEHSWGEKNDRFRYILYHFRH